MSARRVGSVVATCFALALWLPVSGAHAQADDADADSGETVRAKPAAAPAARPNKLRLELAQVRQEREQANLFLPRMTFGVGYGATLVAALSGAGYALACETRCATPNWVAFVVVAGGAIGTVGSLWMLRANAHVARLESRRYQLEQELERTEHARMQRERVLAQAPQFTLHFAL